MMALLDGELTPEQRDRLMRRIQADPQLRQEYLEFRMLTDLTTPPAALCNSARAGSPLAPPPAAASAAATAAASPQEMDAYYRCVCQKLQTSMSWMYWAGASCLAAIGVLMLVSIPNNPFAMALGVFSLVCGAGLLWLSHFCNCKTARSSAASSRPRR